MNAPVTRPTIAFDLDGTLVDTAPDLCTALNLVFDEIGFRRVPLSAMRSIVGHGARVMIERGLALEGKTASSAELDRMLARFLVHYEAHLADDSKPFPGAKQMLDSLKQSGALLVVCTNKFEGFSVKLLQALGLVDYFAVIAGSDTFPMRKPDAGHLLGAVSRAGGHSTLVVMVGDSRTDVATARAANVQVIAVDFGYSDIPAHELGADRVVGKLIEVPDIAHELLQRAQAN
jgi:phosphoglycolate phosphatase